MLDYNIGIMDTTLGCICESMINQSTQELEHGVNLLKESVPEFVLTDRPQIGFDQIEQSFRNYKGFINNIIEILIFDAIIGNQDRHSENWAIIRSLDVKYKENNKRKVSTNLYYLYNRLGLKFQYNPFEKFFYKHMNKAELVDIKFAPIYDSGSSLGRDIHESKIKQFLENKNKIQKYIHNGKSEIRWKASDKKINHFDIIERVTGKYSQKVTDTINIVVKKYEKTGIEKIINQIDANLTEVVEETKLSLQRKELIISFVDSRIERLKEILK